MIGIVGGFVALFSELGTSAAIIQRKHVSDEHLCTAFWFTSAIGVALFVVMVLISPFVASFFGRPMIQPLMTLSSVGFAIGGLGSTHGALLTRELKFKSLAKVQITGAVTTGLLSVVFAFLGFGVWSLVYGALLGGTLAQVALWLQSRWRPKLAFSAYKLRDILSFGINVSGASIANYAGTNLDYLLIGKFLGERSLGLYTFSYQLVTYPQRHFSQIISQAMFPVFSKIQDDQDRLVRGFIKNLRYVSLIVLPALAALFVLAPEFVVGLYGEKWRLAVIPVQIMCVAGATKSIASLSGNLFLATGRPDIDFKWNLGRLPILVVAVYLGLGYGINGVAVAVTIVSVILAPIYITMAGRMVRLRWKDYLKSLYPACLSSFVILVSLTAIKRTALVFLGVGKLATLLLLASSAVAIYALCLKLLKDRSFGELFEMYRKLSSDYLAARKSAI